MSNEALKKYKEETNRLLTLLVELHNKNLHFYKMAESDRAARYVRVALRDIQISVMSLRKQTKLVRDERIHNLKQEKIRIREERERLRKERAINPRRNLVSKTR